MAKARIDKTALGIARDKAIKASAAYKLAQFRLENTKEGMQYYEDVIKIHGETSGYGKEARQMLDSLNVERDTREQTANETEETASDALGAYLGLMVRPNFKEIEKAHQDIDLQAEILFRAPFVNPYSYAAKCLEKLNAYRVSLGDSVSNQPEIEWTNRLILSILKDKDNPAAIKQVLIDAKRARETSSSTLTAQVTHSLDECIGLGAHIILGAKDAVLPVAEARDEAIKALAAYKLAEFKLDEKRNIIDSIETIVLAQGDVVTEDVRSKEAELTVHLADKKTLIRDATAKKGIADATREKYLSLMMGAVPEDKDKAIRDIDVEAEILFRTPLVRPGSYAAQCIAELNKYKSFLEDNPKNQPKKAWANQLILSILKNKDNPAAIKQLLFKAEEASELSGSSFTPEVARCLDQCIKLGADIDLGPKERKTRKQLQDAAVEALKIHKLAIHMQAQIELQKKEEKYIAKLFDRITNPIFTMGLDATKRTVPAKPKVVAADKVGELLQDEVRCENSEYIVLRFLVRTDGSLVFAHEGIPSADSIIPAHFQMSADRPLGEYDTPTCFAAGNAYFDKKTGECCMINNKSGDFKPGFQSLGCALQAFFKSKVAMKDTITMEGVSAREEPKRYVIQKKDIMVSLLPNYLEQLCSCGSVGAKLSEQIKKLKNGVHSSNPYHMNSSKKLNAICTALDNLNPVTEAKLMGAIVDTRSELSQALNMQRLPSLFGRAPDAKAASMAAFDEIISSSRRHP